MSFLENKIPPPIVALAFGVGMWALSSFSPMLTISQSITKSTSAVIAILGVWFCVAGVVSFRRAKTTVNPLKPDAASSLVSAGVYRISRNPMYLGFALILLSLAIYLASPVSMVGVIAFVLYMNKFQITPEEKALEKIFGTEFLTYTQNVRRWL